jgi:hypothetical protein
LILRSAVPLPPVLILGDRDPYSTRDTENERRIEVRGRTLVVVLLCTVCLVGLAAASGEEGEEKRPLFDTSMFRPQVVFHELEIVTDAEFVTISGVVFSRQPVDEVKVGDRVAMVRPAEPKDLVQLERIPQGASEAPFRTYFEVPDAGLPNLGANDIDVRARTADGRESDKHRLTLIKRAPVEAEAADQADSGAAGE